mmetsp:Transcript_8097/g.36830  ORF Transcript_8097/g.36830 Transcript_8097/m.36830 type:complete len:756 (+) Transcript_8097:297-2564(+)
MGCGASSMNQILDAAAIDTSNSGSGKGKGGRARGARPNPRPVADLYAFGATIGRGGFAEVRRAKHMETGLEYAMKVIKLPSRHKRAFKQEIFYEIGLLSKMDSPYVIKLREFFVESDRIIMVTELLEGGDLFDAVVASGHYDERMAKRVFRRILLGVQYLHEVGVTHCDLKLENLLLASKTDLDSVKICDLGLAKKVSARSSSLPSGTPEYISPEVLEANLMADAAEGRGALPQAHGPSVDNWACGVLLFVLLAGYTPFAHEDEHTMYELIRTGNFNFTQSSVWEDVSGDAKDLIERFLTVDEKQRMTAERALATHPWLGNSPVSLNGDAQYRDPPTTPRVHLDNVQKNLQKERDTGKLFKGAVNAVLAINRVQNALANGDKDLITLKSGAASGPGAPPSTFARRKSQGQQQKGPVLAGMPTKSPEQVKKMTKIPSADKMDLLAEVDSDDERDWSVRGGARRGRRGSVSAGGGRSRRGSFAESGGGGEEETVMILQRGARSRRGSIAEAGGRSRRGSFSESGGGGRSRRGSMSETGGRSPQRLSRSSSRTDLSVSRDASPVGRPTSPYSGHQSNSPRVSGNVSPFQRSPRSSEGSEVGETSTTPGLPVKNLSEGSGLSVREKPAKKLSEGSGLSVLNAPEPRRSPSPGVALQDRSHRGRMGQSPLSRSPRSASPAPGGGDGSNGLLATLTDSALAQGVSNRLSQSGVVQFGSGTSWAGSDDETSSRAPSPGPTPPFKELTPRSRLAKASEGSIRT